MTLDVGETGVDRLKQRFDTRPRREYPNLWGQAAMASSLRDRIHRLPDQKTTLAHLPVQLCTPHFLVLPIYGRGSR